MTALPGVLAEIAQIAGEEAAMAIADARGGTQIYVPPIPSNDHWLCRLIGRDQAKAVCDHLTAGVGPRRVDLPLGPSGRAARARAMVDAMIKQERTERDIALATGYTARAIRRRVAKLLERGEVVRTDPQLSLFPTAADNDPD